MDSLNFDSIISALSAVFGDLEGFGDVLKAIVKTFLELGELFRDF